MIIYVYIYIERVCGLLGSTHGRGLVAAFGHLTWLNRVEHLSLTFV